MSHPHPPKKQSKWINGLTYKTKTQQNNKGRNVLCVGVRYNDSYRVKNEEHGWGDDPQQIVSKKKNNVWRRSVTARTSFTDGFLHPQAGTRLIRTFWGEGYSGSSLRHPVAPTASLVRYHLATLKLYIWLVLNPQMHILVKTAWHEVFSLFFILSSCRVDYVKTPHYV